MNLIIIVSALVIVIAGALFNELKTSRDSQQQQSQVQEIETETPEATEEQDSKPTSTPQPSRQPTEPPAQPTPAVQTSLSNLRYPNATVESSSANTLTLKSNDDSDVITDWYKEKISGLGMNTKSFVKTKTNDNVLNKLVGADGRTEIRVEITKPAGNPTTEIKITITSM